MTSDSATPDSADESSPSGSEKRKAEAAAEALSERALAAAQSGDYLTLRKLNGEIARLVPGSELAKSATEESKALRMDVQAVIVGGVALTFFLIGWGIALF